MHRLSIDPDDYITIQHWSFYHSLFVTVAISLVKMSVACFLLRLVTKKIYKNFLTGMLGMSTILVHEKVHN
jgi:hypothetical protein